MAKPTDNSEIFLNQLITEIQKHLRTVGGIYVTTGTVAPSPLPIPGAANWTGYGMEQPFNGQGVDKAKQVEEDLRNENEKDDDTPETEIKETKRILGRVPVGEVNEQPEEMQTVNLKVNLEAEEVNVTSARIITRTGGGNDNNNNNDEEENNNPPIIVSNVGETAPPKPPGLTKAEKNGRLDTKKLSKIDASYGSGILHVEAAKMYNKLLAKAKKAGVTWSVSSTYRDYGGQVSCYKKYGSSSAAKPGSSPHGWGVAIDFGEICGIQETKAKSLKVNRASPDAARYTRNHSKTYNWLSKNAPQFGWFNPFRLADGNGMDEAWHWEYWGFYTLSKEEREG